MIEQLKEYGLYDEYLGWLFHEDLEECEETAEEYLELEGMCGSHLKRFFR